MQLSSLINVVNLTYELNYCFTAAKMASMPKKYHTRGVKPEYKAMFDIVLPRASRREQDILYPVEILKREGVKVKIPYSSIRRRPRIVAALK